MRPFYVLPLLASAYDWSPVDRVLGDAIANGTFPGCAAAVTTPDSSVVLLRGYGTFVYSDQRTPVGGNNPAVTPDSLFDMASLTKILGATTAAALLYQKGEHTLAAGMRRCYKHGYPPFPVGLLDLDMRVADPTLLGPAYGGQGKGNVRVRNLLLHDAGYPPDPVPGYDDPAFGCPATSLADPPLTFNCSELVFASLLTQVCRTSPRGDYCVTCQPPYIRRKQTLQYPTGTAWLYSDLSMITMQVRKPGV